MSTKPYADLSRAEWSALRDRTPLTLTAAEVEELRGLGDVVDLDEVREIYLPLSGSSTSTWRPHRACGTPSTPSSATPPVDGAAHGPTPPS